MLTTVTPGTWAAGVYLPTPTMFERLKRLQSCVCVASPGPDTGMVVAICGDARDPRSQAEADLLSAAPDLLSALLLAIDIIKALHGSAGLDFYMQAAPEMQRIFAAINKATYKPTTLIQGSDHGNR